jgi:hypothetical protein
MVAVVVVVVGAAVGIEMVAVVVVGAAVGIEMVAVVVVGVVIAPAGSEIVLVR